jgi:transposase InsO family protein
MEKTRLMILAVVLEGRTHADVATEFGVTRSWVTKLVGRYRIEGEAAFEPRSRRPHSSPTAIDAEVVDRIVALRHELVDAGLDAGPETIRWHLHHHDAVSVSPATIRRYLIAAGLIEPAPKKRPKSSYIRFQADLPNEMWQSDMTHVALSQGEAEVLSWLDDHSRYALDVTAHARVNTAIVNNTFDKTAGQHGYPASVLTDNGMYFTARFARGGATSLNRFERHLAELGIDQKHSRPNHPTTCGKVERFQQTMKKWLRARPAAVNLEDLQTLLDEFVDEYNHRRPHRSLGRATPAAVYNQLPKAGPGTDTTIDYRLRRDRIDHSGKVTLRYNSHLYKIGIGRAHAGTAIIMLIANRDIRIINPTTGQTLRQLTLDPNRTYQPQN